MNTRFGVALSLAALVAAVVAQPSSASARTNAPPVVVAVVDELGGVNVLHHDFRTRDGRTPAYPAAMPTPVMVTLPAGTDFATTRSALNTGPLGHMQPGVLYGVAGTRLLLVNAGTSPYDAIEPPGHATDSATGAEPAALHATGVADSVTGTAHGTEPHALVVVVLSNTDGAYPWLAANSSWVDLATASAYTAIHTTSGPTQCVGASEVRAFTAAGRQYFSSGGNTTDEPEPLIVPNGMPQTYIVGGVDATGHTWLPGHTEEADPAYAAGTVVRPYETGELYSYRAAAPDSFDGTTHFGGTSGATPRTAGWAAHLVAHARQVLRQGPAGAGTALAAGMHRPARGPLADGRFTRVELVSLLHEVAVPHSGLPAGASYAAEGFGALNATAIAHADRILDGSESLPSRPADEQADGIAHQARAALFTRC